MIRKITFTLIASFSFILCNSQENEFGFMLNVANTTLLVPNGGMTISSGGAISQDADNTGYEMNFAIGLYGSFNIQNRLNIGADLFYDKTTSKNLDNVSFSAINLIPYFDYDIFGINLFINVGGGIGYITSHQNPEDRILKLEKVDFVAKLALAYKFENLGRIEIGMYSGVTSVVKNSLSRHKYYIGIKFPIDKYLK